MKHPVLKLNATQKKHYAAIKWLLDDDGPMQQREKMFVEKNRQTGRSTLMMVVLIEVAMAHRNRWYRAADHCPVELISRSQDRVFLKNFEERVKKLGIPVEEGHFVFDHKRLRFRFV